MRFSKNNSVVFSGIHVILETRTLVRGTGLRRRSELRGMQVSWGPGQEFSIPKWGVLLLVFLPNLLYFMAVGDSSIQTAQDWPVSLYRKTLRSPIRV